MKIYVAHSTKYNFLDELYIPLKNSELIGKHNFIFPHETDKWINSKEVIKESDILIAEVTLPATGLGIELGWANAFNKPIICLYKKGTDYSRSVSAVTQNIFEYEQENLVEIISNNLKN